jgi:hypothetical protein
MRMLMLSFSSGLFVDVLRPHLAASPDGIVVGEEAVMEVKCPFNGREDKIAPGKKFLFLEKRDGGIHLKKGHSYFYQIMGQMAICKKPVCYFVVYTFCDIMIEKIEFDEHFYANMLPLLETFYTEHYVPAIVSTL